jgi:hypothetical protein
VQPDFAHEDAADCYFHNAMLTSIRDEQGLCVTTSTHKAYAVRLTQALSVAGTLVWKDDLGCAAGRRVFNAVYVHGILDFGCDRTGCGTVVYGDATPSGSTVL